MAPLSDTTLRIVRRLALGDPAWSEAARSLREEDRRHLLAWADGEHAAGGLARERAHAVYRVLADTLDPRAAADLPRIDALLDGHSGAQADLEGFWLRVEEHGTPPQAAAALDRLASISALRGDFAEAEQRYQAALAGASVVGEPTASTVLSSYAGFCVRMDREIEALVFARLALPGLVAQGEPWRLAYLRWIEASTHARFEDWPRLDDAIDAFATAVMHCGPRQTLRAAPEQAQLETLHALGVGDLDAAEAGLAREQEAWRALGGMSALRALEWTVLRVRALAGRGRAAEALRAADAALAGAARPDDALDLAVERGVIALGAGAPPDDGLVGLVARLARGTPEQPRTATRARLAVRLAEALLATGHSVAAHAVYDVAAALSLERLVDLERFSQVVPALAQPHPEDLALLEAYRRRMAGRARVLAGAVAGLLTTSARETRSAALLAADAGFLAVCAWCQRVRLKDGRWLSVQQFLPLAPAGPLQLTHGLCPACLPAVTREVTGARG